jgi:hypothetical protein
VAIRYLLMQGTELDYIIRVGFVVDKLAISEVFLTVRLCSPVSKNQVMLHTHVTLINDSRCATLANVRIGK